MIQDGRLFVRRRQGMTCLLKLDEHQADIFRFGTKGWPSWAILRHNNHLLEGKPLAKIPQAHKLLFLARMIYLTHNRPNKLNLGSM